MQPMKKGALMTYDLIIENGILLTADEDSHIHKDGLICIAGGEIMFAGPRDKAPERKGARQVVDACGGIIMPGLVNSHTHVPMSIFRGLADDLPLETWLNEHMFPAEASHINPETVRIGTLLSCAEMLLSGTTCFCDGYFYEDAVAQAASETGLRAVLAHGIIDFPAPGVPDPSQNVRASASYAKEWKGKTPLITPSIFCHSPYTCSAETIQNAKKEAAALGVLLQIHAAESKFEHTQSMEQHGLSPVRYLDGLGVLDENTLVVHGVWVDDKDMEILSQKNAAVSVTTHSEMKLASGVAPIPAYLRAGVRVGLGTDGPASNNNHDMFSEMDLTAKIHKALNLDPTELDAATAIALAARMSADAIGLGAVTGSLEKGKRADIIVIDVDAPNMTPMYHPESAVVYAASADNVKHVFVDGRQLVQDGRLTSMDLEKIMDEVRSLAKAIGG
ncbi:amidohydrolase [Desulfatibacillum aliphaticivorans]|uniref:5-methylthioadenosine/S-adenosylhomocysteine deaminase n=1 Tax=Desulfatibacillum aliphaticivorans TaxID=218208 RepID=B8FB46_DESAL|nr:amidohydrolase [Desulfatibacillum aliphaticivorans]ACL04132.1 amidohydrolase [Desulfatibacillum aliphaticivorans]